MNNPVYILRLIAYIGQDSVCQLGKKLLSHEQCFLVVEFALKWKYSLKKGQFLRKSSMWFWEQLSFCKYLW